MNKTTLKYALLLSLFILLLVPSITSSIFDLQKMKEEEIKNQELLAQQQAQKEKEEMEEKKYLLGKFDPETNADFSLIPKEFVVGGNKMYLRKEALNAFLKMQESASKNGVNLKIVSATRNFEYQRKLWDDKWSGITLVDGKNLSKSISDGLERFKKVLEYTAVPGISRHHWGTDIDINNTDPSYFNGEKGIVEYQWLTKNAWVFGFCQPYNLRGSDRPNGHNGEKWHWSYFPLANILRKDFANLIKDEDINGFMGDQYVTGQNLINEYVMSINPNCFHY